MPAHRKTKTTPVIYKGTVSCHLQRYWSLSSVPNPPKQGGAPLSAGCNDGRYACELYLYAIAGNVLL